MSKWSLNKEKTLELFLEKVRESRTSKLAELDIEFLRALETNDESTKSAIITQKTNLRDLPSTFTTSSFSTPQELYNQWPSGSLGKSPY